MNGFSMMADEYKELEKSGQITEDVASKIKCYEFLGTCSDNDFFTLFDSTAFNEIMMSYIRKAVRELTEEDTIEDEQARAVRNRVNNLLSEKTAKDIWEC